MNNAGRTLRHRGNARLRRRALRTFDRLPPPLRRALHEALMDWDPRWIKAELWSFAERWPAHVRANATLQRYRHHG